MKHLHLHSYQRRKRNLQKTLDTHNYIYSNAPSPYDIRKSRSNYLSDENEIITARDLTSESLAIYFYPIRQHNDKDQSFFHINKKDVRIMKPNSSFQLTRITSKKHF